MAAPPTVGQRRFRFAPTPSRLLHVGNGLAALVGWAEARRTGGAFVLRIEDIDTTRCTEDLEAACLEDLRWLGLDWDEGPDVGGPFAPYRQSQRLERFDTILRDLVQRGAAYACTCSRARIRAAQRAPHLEGGGERPYPGTCRTHQETLDPERGGYRLKVDDLGVEAVITWLDTWMGGRTEDVRETCGDFLLGRPGSPSYQLAVVVDDAQMGITDVVRGRDLLGSTARQLLLHGRLAHQAPTYAHHPLLVDTDGRKLSKRDHALTLRSLRERGVRAERVIAALARAIGLDHTDHGAMSPKDFAMLLNEHPRWRDGTWADLQ
ncbi:MAG: tRNA glutamyl-Q(34) synthetase GluQRS [Myxococcota bacterium]|nr:tRNA glutamyl-Q(34) synthetase GluQRS [Myxococcota bacterium]